MNFRIVLYAVLLIATTSAQAAQDWTAAVEYIQSTSILQDCLYFTLTGVTEADPATPSNPYFAIPRSQYGAKDAYAMLLTARAAGARIRVTTTGNTVCGGYAQISQMILVP
jgi:hypothetical protein